MNSEIVYKNEDYKRLEKSDDNLAYLKYSNAKRYVIPLKYLVGTGFIFIVIGILIRINEMI